MAIEYQPRQARPSFAPSAEDTQYAEVFTELGIVIDQSRSSERLVLRLSTCRNGYLTVNALFVDLCRVLGHGIQPSLLSRAIEHLRRGEQQKMSELLNDARVALSSYSDKRSVWNQREELDTEFERCLSVAPVRPAQRDRIRRVLRSDRTQTEKRGPGWDPVYYRWSSAEPGPVPAWLASLDRVHRKIDAIVAVCRSIARFTAPASLFGDETPNTWRDIFRSALPCAAELEMTLSPDENELRWSDGGVTRRFPVALPGETEAGLCIRHLTERLSTLERQVYEHLAGGFRLNEKAPPLPPPFRIDLTEREPSVPPSRQQLPAVQYIDHAQAVPRSIRVAIPDFGIPTSWYNMRYKHYEDAKREEVGLLAKEMLLCAHLQNATALVLPEYFLPRAVVDELSHLASEKGISLISGVEAEGSPTPDPLLVNEVVIQLPDSPSVSQWKQRPSVYESPLYETGGLKVFRRTSLGTFAVLVCSDFLQVDIMWAIAAAAPIDVLFVCSFNPKPDLFEAMATADACRLYCHVVIANNCLEDGEAKASSRGSLTCSPVNSPDQMIQANGARTELALAEVGGTTPGIRVYDLSLEAMAKHNGKAADGYLPVPVCRQLQP